MTSSSPLASHPDRKSLSTPETGDPDRPARIRGSLRRLLLWFIPGTIGISVVWGTVPGILLPLQVTAIDAADKVVNLAFVSTIGAFAAMIAQPISGMISDRTRSRFGRRSPWIFGGVLLGGLALIGIGLSNSIILVAVSWTVAQFAYNFAQAPLTAILPDRVPRSARGSFAAIIGAFTMVGALGGSLVAAQFAENLPMGFTVVAGLSLTLIALFLVFNPDASNRREPRERFRAGDFLSTFWVNPLRHPDFFWAFTGRLLLYSGYFAITGYQLFLLQDYVGMGDEAVFFVPLLALAGLPTLLLSVAVCGPLSDRLGRRKVFIFASAVVVAIAQLIPLLVPTLVGMILFALVAGLGFGAFQAVDTALMTEVLPDPDAFAKDLGVINIAATLPQTVAPAVAGAIVLTVGYAGLFPVAIGLSLLGGAAVYAIRSVR
ncbi:MFS transporter [Microbacterium sp. NPDC088619]|uniref:MFS transporter n=1 Tax=Microbacterium sp. NPDC088619 TaxID=3364196 RepID=UPI0037F3EA84